MFIVDDTTYLEIYFDVTGCDNGTYLCSVLDSPDFDEGQDQQSLEVVNCKSQNTSQILLLSLNTHRY